MSKNVLLISVDTVKDRSPVHKGMDDSLIYPEIKIAQDMYIVHAIGTNLMERLQEGIENSDLTADETTLLDDYIIDALVQFTLAGLPRNAAYQLFTKGALRRTSDNAELPSLSDVVDITAYYKDRGEFYRERLIKYLRVNRALFPLYTERNCSDDIQPSGSGYSVPMWLDDSDECC